MSLSKAPSKIRGRTHGGLRMTFTAPDPQPGELAAIKALWLASRRQPNARYVCPVCAPHRKKEHRRERTLSIKENDGLILFKCHHCPAEGSIKMNEAVRVVSGSAYKPRLIEHSPPPPAPVVDPGVQEPVKDHLDDPRTGPALAWFQTERHISADTLKKCGVSLRQWKFRSSPEPREALVFPYKAAGKTYAQKLRSYPDKQFSQVGSASTLWLDWLVVPGDDLLVVEGELDALSAVEAGLSSVVSAPAGAPSQVSDRAVSGEDKKFQFVYAARDLFTQAPRVLLAGDNDGPGAALMEEIARRVGKGRCWKVTWPDGCKDANDTLVKHGKQGVLDAVAGAQPWPVQGVYDAKHYADMVLDLHRGGLSAGTSTGIPSIDELYTVVPGHLTVVTGAPGSGKTAFLNAVMVNLAKTHGWRFAVYSTEVDPHVHIAQLAALYAGKPFFDGPTPKLSEAEMIAAVEWVNRYFCFIELDEAATPAAVIDKLSVAVMRYGVVGFVVDPASYLSHSSEGEGSDWVGSMLEAFKLFARAHDCAAWLVAHPLKLRQREDGSTPIPRGYEVSGSAHWANRPDFGLTVHRPHDNRTTTELHVWKARFSWTGREGKTELFFDRETGRYSDTPFNQSIVYSFSEQEEKDPWEM